MPLYRFTRDQIIGHLCGMRKGQTITMTEEQAKPFGSAVVLVSEEKVSPQKSTPEPQKQKSTPEPQKSTPEPVKVDDLTKIKGVSRKRQEILNEMGIKTYGQLVFANPNDVADRIPQANASTVKSWQAQAKQWK